MKITDVRLAVSPITDTVMAGTIMPDGVTWREKHDCTNDFFAALLVLVPPGAVREINSSSGKRYEIKVVEIDAETRREK